MDPETVHKLIHCNLQQLNLLHPASYTFMEGMFKVPNKRGFENVMLYLLNIVDPVKCAKVIPWPLLDRKGESQFRTSVKIFLMEINSDYPEANLPKIVPSFLMNPGGDKFAYFMWKLTKFVLFKSLCQTYGTLDILLPPRTFVNDPMVSAKLNLVCALAESATRKAVSNQLKMDSLFSQECERQCHIQLSELTEAITKYGNLLKELVKDSLVSAEMREKLCSSFDDTNVIAEWAGVVEAEGRVLEAVIHVLNMTGSSVTNLLETIKQAEDNDASQLCLDPSSLNICTGSLNSMADDFKEIMKNAQRGKLTLSEFIESLIRSQASLIQHIVNNGLQDMSTALPDLCSVNTEFKELAVMLSNVEAKLQETLNCAQSSCEALHEEFKTLKSEPTDKTEVSSSIDLPIPDGAIGEDVYITDQTPDRDVTGNIFSKLTKNKTVANIVIDPQLIQTPEFDRKFDSPVHLPDVHSTRKEYETPMHKNNYVLPATTSKKPHSSDLRSLTKSLVRKKNTAGTAAKLQSVPRLCKSHKARAAPAVNKELFKKSKEDTEEKLGQLDEFSTLLPVGGSSSVTNANEDHVLPSSVPEDDLTSSPSSLFCSSEPTETEPQTNKKQNRRNSLIDIIERYRKVRNNMKLS